MADPIDNDKGYPHEKDLWRLEQHELREHLAFLIQHREALRNKELHRLEHDVQGLMDRLQSLERQKLLEELACFKDILALHRRALSDNGSNDT